MFALALLLGACTGDDDSAKNDQRLGFGDPKAPPAPPPPARRPPPPAATTTAPPASPPPTPPIPTSTPPGYSYARDSWWRDARAGNSRYPPPPPARPAQSERATTSQPNDEDRQEIRGSRRRPSPRWPRESVLWSSRQTEHIRRQASANPVSIAARFSAAKGPAPAARNAAADSTRAGSSPR